MSWWCNDGGGSVAGIAFVGTLCSSYNTNLNEKRGSLAASGFVSALRVKNFYTSRFMENNYFDVVVRYYLDYK